jgi:hypothetical protein
MVAARSNVSMSFSRKFPDWIHAKRNIFRILHLPELTLKRSGNGKHVDYVA